MQLIVCTVVITFAVCVMWFSRTLHKSQQQGNGQLDKYEWED